MKFKAAISALVIAAAASSAYAADEDNLAMYRAFGNLVQLCKAKNPTEKTDVYQQANTVIQSKSIEALKLLSKNPQFADILKKAEVKSAVYYAKLMNGKVKGDDTTEVCSPTNITAVTDKLAKTNSLD